MYLLLLLFGQLQPIPMPNGDAVEAIMKMDAASQYEPNNSKEDTVSDSVPRAQTDLILDAMIADVKNNTSKYQKAYMDGVFGAQGAWEAMDPATRPHGPFAVDQRGSYTCCMASFASCLDVLLGYQSLHSDQPWRYAVGWGPGTSYGRPCSNCCDPVQVIKYSKKLGYAFIKKYSQVDLSTSDKSLRYWAYTVKNNVPDWILKEIADAGHLLPDTTVKRYSAAEWSPSLAVDVFAQGGSIATHGYKTGNGRPFGYSSIMSHVQAVVGLDGSPEMRAWVKTKWGKTLADDDMVAWFDQSFSTEVDGWRGEISAADWPPWYPIKRYPGAWPWRLKDAMRLVSFWQAYIPPIGGDFTEPVPEPIQANTIPYLQTFDTDLPMAGWAYKSTNDGRIGIINNRLRMDDSTNGGYSKNTAILYLDLLGQSDVYLSGYHKSLRDEIQGPDGIYFSPDGELWNKLTNFNAATNGVFKVKLTPPFTKYSCIKFQQYDNYSAPYDGREWDDILVDVQLKLTLPITEFFDELPVIGWDYSSSGDGRIGVVDGRLRLDDATNGGYSSNTVTINIDLQGTPATLTYLQYRLKDEFNRLPSRYTGYRNGDGVSISSDGISWKSFPPNTQRINLPADTTQIKFQQYDNYSAPYDGREWDNVIIKR